MPSDRILKITSAYNFRDLGGYETEDGRHVKWRVFLRSGDFPKLSREDAECLTNIPIRSVVDFRAKEEIERTPDSVLYGSKTYCLSIDSGNLIPQFIELKNDKTTAPDVVYKRAIKLMNEMYNDIIRNHQSAYRSFFKLVQDQEVPILFHCTAGKDRTGVAAALLLLALGVKKHVVFEDYVLTNECLVGKYDGFEEFGKLVDFFQTVRKEYLETAFKTIETEYGSIEDFLVKQLNVDLEKIKSMYLEK